MTTTTTHLVSRARRWALVASLTGLVIALGVVLGGTFVWLFAALAVIFNLAGYYYSDRIALRMAGAQPLGENDLPEVRAVVRELTARAGIPAPRLYLMPGEQPNAFATGRNPRHSAVAMTEGLLMQLPLEQVRGVLAHELAHVKNQHILVSSVAAMIAGAVSALANVLQLSLLFGTDEDGNPLGLLGSLALILASLGAALLQLGVSRQREYLADATAARLMDGGAPLADALEEIDHSQAPALEVNPVTAPMYIANPFSGARVSSLFSTHPPVTERVRRLRAYRSGSPRQRPTRGERPGGPARRSRDSMSSRLPRALLAAAAVSLALAGCGTSEKPPTAATAAPPGAGVPRADSFSRIPAIVRTVQPNVVTVLTGQGVGSGVIYRSDGVILTNEHVVGANRTVHVAFADGRRERGDVLASDRDTDLAIVKVDRHGLPAATFQPKLPAVGTLAVVLGSPLGFEKSVTAGIVSGLHREIPGSARESSALVDLMQTDAPISPGNSGGAVVDGRGHVIGVAEAYIPPTQGAVAIGFAIPAVTAITVAEQLLESGHVEHAFLGIQPAQLNPQLAQRLGIRERSGVLVYAVTRGGPADRAQIEPGDVLVKLAGKRVPTVEELFAVLREHRPDQTVLIQLARGNQHWTVDLKLSAKPG